MTSVLNLWDKQMGENHEKNRGVKLPNDINNKREYLFFDQVPNLDVLTADNLFTNRRSIPDVCPVQPISDKQIYSSGQSIFSESTNDIYLNDEESMIPKGLLDIPCDKNEETETNSSDINPCTQQYSIPCFIAFIPPGSITERYQPNFGQFSTPYGYPPSMQAVPLPLPTYTRPQVNEYYHQCQRNVRTLSAQTRCHQGLELSWWNSTRTSPQIYTNNLNTDLRMFNSQRNPNVMHNYEAYQQHPYGRYPMDYGQVDLNFSPNLNLGYEHNHGSQDVCQIPFSKTFHKNNSKVGKESQTFGINNTPKEEVQIPNNTLPNTSSIEEESLPQSNDSTLYHQNDLDQNSYPQNDANSTSEENFEMDLFHHAALYGCLQLEQILSTKKIVSEVDLKDCCIRLKNQLSKSNNSTPIDSTLKEMILAFLHICNSWVSLNCVKSAKLNQLTKEYNFDSLVESFENWETKSKLLLDSLIIHIQYMTSNNHNKDTFSSYAMKCSNKPKETQQVLNLNLTDISHSVIKTDKDKMDCLSKINFSKSNSHDKENKIESIKKSNQYSLGQLSPETHQQENSFDSGFICDNFMKELKISQEKNKSCDSNKLSFQDNKQPKQNNMFRGKFLRTEQHGNTSKSENIDKMFPNLQMPKYPLPTQMDSFRAKEDYNLKNISNNVKSNQEDNNVTHSNSTDKHTDQPISFEKLQSHTNEGVKKQSSLESELFKKNSCFLFANSFQNEEKELSEETKLENTISPRQCRLNDLGSGKRYSLRPKRRNKNVNFTRNKKSSDNEGTPGAGEYISSNIKLKMYDILLGIQSIDIKTLATQRIKESEISKIRQSLINPLMNIGHTLSRNFYKTMYDVIDDVYVMFYRAKRENKGNITILTVVNRLELRLMNTMFDEIGIC